MTIERIYKKIFPDRVYLKEYEDKILEEIYEYVIDKQEQVVYTDIHKALQIANKMITDGEGCIAQSYIETAIHKLSLLEEV
jgi:predicted house-cleaning noncanonical NTP pyrophosphatase (MazG superfamily)